MDQKGLLLGDFSLKDALEKAKSMRQDLVLVNIGNKPPICKIYNYAEELLENFRVAKSKKVEVEITEDLKTKDIYLMQNIKLNDLQIKVFPFLNEKGQNHQGYGEKHSKCLSSSRGR